MIKELIKVANRLDTLGLKREADTVDGLIKRFAAETDDESQDAADWSEEKWDRWNSEAGTFPATLDVEDKINDIKFNVRIALSLLSQMESDNLMNTYNTVHNQGPGFKQRLKWALAGYEKLLALLEANNPYKQSQTALWM